MVLFLTHFFCQIGGLAKKQYGYVENAFFFLFFELEELKYETA